MDKDSVYRTRRLTLRGITREDANEIVRWRSDPENYRNFFNARPVTLEDHLAWFERYLDDPTRYDFMVIDSGGCAIGTAGLSGITPERCEVSYMIGEKSARRHGYATEALVALRDIAVQELGVSEVIARILPHNEVSMSVARGGGFSENERTFSYRVPQKSDTRLDGDEN